MMETTVPAEHQKLGRQAKGFDRAKWDQRECLERRVFCLSLEGRRWSC